MILRYRRFFAGICLIYMFLAFANAALVMGNVEDVSDMLGTEAVALVPGDAATIVILSLFGMVAAAFVGAIVWYWSLETRRLKARLRELEEGPEETVTEQEELERLHEEQEAERRQLRGR